MRSFEKERIHSTNVQSQYFKQPIPVVFVTAKKTTQNTAVIIFNGGLGATNVGNLYLNHDFYDEHIFVSYEKMGHGNNTNKPSQYRNKYLKELDSVVDWATQKFPNKKIFLIGESWGAAINLVYSKIYFNKITGTLNWNMPIKPKDSEKNTAKVIWECAIKEIWTILTNITTYLPVVQKNHDKVSRNPLLLRAMSLRAAVKQNSKTTLAVWRYMRASKKFLLKHCPINKINFLYVQSGEDLLQDYKFIDKIKRISLPIHFKYIPTGYHMLSYEPVEATILYEILDKFIKRS